MCLFFFQAEDGIRDYKVTGVQTCALPITSHPPTPCVFASGTATSHASLDQSAGAAIAPPHASLVSLPALAPRLLSLPRRAPGVPATAAARPGRYRSPASRTA